MTTLRWREDTPMPTRSELGGMLGCSAKSIDRAVLELMAYGWLEVESGRFNGGASVYTVTDDPANRMSQSVNVAEVAAAGGLDTGVQPHPD